MDVEEILTKSSFSMLKDKIDNRILDSLQQMGLEKPTRIQAETLPHLLLGEDIIGAAKTGSGKTLAFLIPVIDKLIKLGFTRRHGNNLKYGSFGSSIITITHYEVKSATSCN